MYIAIVLNLNSMILSNQLLIAKDDISDTLTTKLSEFSPEQKYEDRMVLRAKEIVGNNYSTEEIKSMIASFEYLVTNWLEEYEKKIFNNRTLRELLQSV